MKIRDNGKISCNGVSTCCRAFCTPSCRRKMKKLTSKLRRNFKSDISLYEIICDETNNNQEVKDQRKIVIDIFEKGQTE